MGVCWNSRAVRILETHASNGATLISEQSECLFGDYRSVDAIKSAAKRHRISLRREGCKRGLILGQPRGVPIAELPDLQRELRERHLAGDTELELLEQRVAHDRRTPPPVCPSCGSRLVRVDASGLCRVCHVERLVEAHEERLTELKAQSVLWVAQQRVSRLSRQTLMQA